MSFVDLLENTVIHEWQRGEYTISTDPARIEVERVHDFLSNTAYWALGRPLETVRRSIENSLVFGVYNAEQQVGLARVVTDYATFAWLCDVFILEPFRGQHLGEWLIETVVSYPELQNLRLWLLGTRDAHWLYRKYGFEVEERGRWMTRRGTPPTG